MADLLQNVQEVFKKWESKSAPNRGRSRYNSFHNRPHKSSYRNDDRSSSFTRSNNFREFRKPRYTAPKYDTLAEFKMAPTVVPLQNPRPYVGMPCVKCVPRSRAGIDDPSVYLLGVYNVLQIPYFPLETLNICCIWNLFKMNQFMQHDFSVDLLNCKQIEDAIQTVVDASAKEDTSEIVTSDTLYRRGKAILCNLKASISSVCVLTTAFFVHHLFKRFFRGIFVHKGQMEILKILHKEDIPFVYLPLHRSYFDYILVSYVLHMNSLKTPYIVVPDKLNIPILSSIFRILGAVFVKNNLISSKLETDILYDTIVKNYIVRCLGSNNDIQLFIEGSCSASGKPQVPNINLLSAIVNSVSEGSLEDVYIVPVSITYESTKEHAADQLESDSVRKEISFISKLYSLWKLIHLSYENVRMNFNQPFSVKEFLREHSKSCNQRSLPFNSDVEELSKSQVEIKHLATHVIYDATQSSSLMSTHLLAFLFVTQYRKGGTQQQLQNSMDRLREEIIRKKWDLGFSGESLPVIRRVVELLGKELVSTKTIEVEWTSSDLENNNVKVMVYSPVLKLPHVLELQYYANAVVPIFVKESIVVNALYALVDVDICHFHHCDSRFYVSREELLQKSITLNNFLKYEFITIAPCQDITSVFNDVIDQLIEKECLSSSGGEHRYFDSYKKSHALSFNISSDEEQDDCDVAQQLKIDLREESISHLEFLRSILSPYIESYWLAACSLLRLIDEVKEESVFIREMQMTAEDKLYKGLLAYEESFSATTLKNSLKMFSDHNIIEYYIVDNIKTLCLSEPYNSVEGINEIIADIEDFRK